MRKGTPAPRPAGSRRPAAAGAGGPPRARLPKAHHSSHSTARTHAHSILLSKSKSKRKERTGLGRLEAEVRRPALTKGEDASWALRAALEDRPLGDAEVASPSSSSSSSSSSPSEVPQDLASLGKGPALSLKPGSVKVRVARNSEELKAVAALRVSIFQQFVSPDGGKKRDGQQHAEENRGGKAGPDSGSVQRKNGKARAAAVARSASVARGRILRGAHPQGLLGGGRRSRSPSPSAMATVASKPAKTDHRQEQASLARSVEHLGGRTQEKVSPSRSGMPAGSQDASRTPAADFELREQWLRKQSGLEAARIYNLGERCICLLAVYHPKDEEERNILFSQVAQAKQRSPKDQEASRGQGQGRGPGGSLGGRLLSPFFRWQAPPVPKVPVQHSQKENEENFHALEDEDGGLIVGTLNIHFDQPFRPRAKVLKGKPAQVSKQQSAASLQHSNNMSVLRAVENTNNNRAQSAKAKMLNSLWRMKHQQQRQIAVVPDFFQLPSEEKALQKVKRDCKQAYIFNLCVSPAFRRQGIASMLLDRAHEIAIKKDIEECFLHVDFGNDAAEKLYEENGYAFEEDEEGKWTYIAGSRPRQLMKKAV